MVTRVFRLLAIACLALSAASFAPTPANALSRTSSHHLNRQIPHNAIAKRNKSKRSNTKRCKQRSSSASAIATAPAVVHEVSSQAPAASPLPASVSVKAASSSKAAAPAPSTNAAQVTTKAAAAPSSYQAAAAPSSSKAAAAPSSSSSQAASPASSSAPASNDNGSKKIGLAWPNGATSDLQYYVTPSVGWIYTWSPDTPDPTHQYDLEFMAMLWGPDQITEFNSVVQAGYANYILAFNEPNEEGQSNLDPGYAAQLWKQYIEPKRALGYQTCSPATSSNPNGFTWMDNFSNACDGGCTVDFICVHWYDVDASNFKTYVEQWHNTYNKDIFITEFAPQNFNGGAQPSTGDVWAFYQEVMPWISQTSYIKAAFPFGFMHDMSGVNLADQLMASSGQPTDLGWYIINGQY